MDDEEWEVIPHKILADLRDEVHLLKEKISQPSTRKDMSDAMVDLKQSIDQMQSIFKVALETTEKDSNAEIMAKLATIEKQNEQIAQALVSIADLVENKREMPDLKMPTAMPLMPTPIAPPMRMLPPMPSMRAPPPLPRSPSMSQLPPPPPAPPKRGLLGKLIK